MTNREKMYQAIADTLEINVADVTDSLSQDDVGNWDSMAMVNLISELESVFGISFDIDEIVNFKNVGLIKSVLVEKGVEF